MAFGFPASYTTSIELSGDRVNAREIVRSIFDLLGWNYVEHDADTFTATVPMSGSSWGEKVIVTLEPHGVLKVHSVCSFPQIFDWGKNKRNVEAFVERFSIHELRNLKGSESPEHFDNEGKTPLDRVLTDSESHVEPDDVTK